MLVVTNSLIVLIMQVIFVYAMLEKRFSKNKTLVILIPSVLIIFIVAAILFAINGYDFVARYYLLIIGLPIYIILFYLSKHRGFCMLFNILTSGFLETLISMPGYFFTKSFNTYIIVSLIGRLVLFPLVLLFLVKIFRPLYMQMIEKLKKVWALLCLIPLLSYVIIAHLLVYPVNIFDRPENVITLSISMIIIVTSYAVIFVFFKQMSQQFTIESEQQLLKSQIGALQNQLSTINEVEEKANILKHDMRHYIQNISVLLQSGNSDETVKFIDKFEDMFKQASIPKYCDNKVINAILAYYIENAKKEGIAVTTRLDIPEKISVDEIELSTVFANAIENACNACGNLPDGLNKSIELVCVSKPHFVLEIANTYIGTTIFDKSGMPTSKNNGHGIGTQSIAAFVKNHNAILDYQTENGMFKLRILLK